MRITAAVIHQLAAPFLIEELDLDDPQSDEVLVRLLATGVCHTDLAHRDGWGGNLPMVFGHEGAGVIERVGGDVTRVKVGDHVVLTFGSCGRCANCMRGLPSYCSDFGTYNFRGARPDGSIALRRGDAAVAGS